MYLRRHNHSYLWNYFQLDLLPAVQLRHNWAASTQLVSHYSQIWHGSGFFFQSVTIFSIQQFTAQPHHRFSFYPKFSASTPILLHMSQQSSTNGWQNLLSLHVDNNSLPTLTRGRRRRQEPSPSLPLSPASFTPHQRPHTHTLAYASPFLSTLTIAPSPWPTLLLWINEFSINQRENVDENDTEASEVSDSTDSCSLHPDKKDYHHSKPDGCSLFSVKEKSHWAKPLYYQQIWKGTKQFGQCYTSILSFFLQFQH